MEECAQFFSLISEEGALHNQKVSDDRKLELRLGQPGEIHDQYQKVAAAHGAKGVLKDTTEARNGGGSWFMDTDEKQCTTFAHNYGTGGEKLFSSSLSGSFHSSAFQREGLQELKQMKSSYNHSSRVVDMQWPDKKPFSNPGSASVPAIASRNNSSAKRAAIAPVAGWPPIRSSRKHLVSSCTSKLAFELPTENSREGYIVEPESPRNDLFVKINMEGVPIGRKINLNAYDSYETLSTAIDELFRSLLAAQMKFSASEGENEIDEEKANERPVAGNGIHTLVYEDNEGDRILVGDVPWNMFVTTAKRLYVLKSSDL